MTEMVERVAEAIVLRRGLPVGTYINWDAFRADARAAIEAMRVPTEAMVEAAYERVMLDDQWHIDDADRFSAAFNASISAALK